MKQICQVMQHAISNKRNLCTMSSAANNISQPQLMVTIQNFSIFHHQPFTYLEPKSTLASRDIYSHLIVIEIILPATIHFFLGKLWNTLFVDYEHLKLYIREITKKDMTSCNINWYYQIIKLVNCFQEPVTKCIQEWDVASWSNAYHGKENEIRKK